MPRKKSNQSYHSIGRRKKSVVRVYMVQGSGKILVGEKNSKTILSTRTTSNGC